MDKEKSKSQTELNNNTDKNNQENTKLPEIKYEDLVVAKKNGKCAIFNKENSTFITEHLFDVIILTESGYHTAYNAEELIDEEGRVFKYLGTITYSAVIDNYGNIKEFEDIVFGHNGYFIGDVCPAFYKKTGKVHLVDYNKGIISEGFYKISPYDTLKPYGIYTAFKYDEEQKTKVIDKILYKDGSIIDVKIEESSYFWQDYIMTNVNTLTEMIDLIKKYGATIIELTSMFVFTTKSSFIKILLTINEYFPDQLEYTIDLLDRQINNLYSQQLKGNLDNLGEENAQNVYHIEENEDFSTYKLTKASLKNEISLEEINAPSQIDAEYYKKKIDSLFTNYRYYLSDPPEFIF